MEPPSKSLRSETQFSDPEAPKTPYEKQLFEAMRHAEMLLGQLHLACVNDLDFGQSEAASRGLLLAYNRLIASHLINHCTSMLLPFTALDREIETITKNIRLMVDEHYQKRLDETILAAAEGETKQ